MKDSQYEMLIHMKTLENSINTNGEKRYVILGAFALLYERRDSAVIVAVEDT